LLLERGPGARLVVRRLGRRLPLGYRRFPQVALATDSTGAGLTEAATGSAASFGCTGSGVVFTRTVLFLRFESVTCPHPRCSMCVHERAEEELHSSAFDHLLDHRLVNSRALGTLPAREAVTTMDTAVVSGCAAYAAEEVGDHTLSAGEEEIPWQRTFHSQRLAQFKKCVVADLRKIRAEHPGGVLGKRAAREGADEVGDGVGGRALQDRRHLEVLARARGFFHQPGRRIPGWRRRFRQRPRPLWTCPASPVRFGSHAAGCDGCSDRAGHFQSVQNGDGAVSTLPILSKYSLSSCSARSWPWSLPAGVSRFLHLSFGDGP